MSDLAGTPKPSRPDALPHRLRQAAAWLLAWRRRRRSSPAWTIIPALLAAVMALPLATIACSRSPARQRLAASQRTVLPGGSSTPCCCSPVSASLTPGLRRLHGLARHHVPVSRPRRHRPPPGAAARHADLHRRLRLGRAAGLSGPVQGLLRCAVRLAVVPRLLVSRGAQHGRRHRHPVGRALPLRLSLRPRELRAAVRLRAGGRAHAGPHLGRHLLVRGAAAGTAGARRRRGAGPDGVPQRSGRRAVPGRADAERQHLYHLAAALEPRRRRADRARRGAVRAGADAGRARRTRRGQFHHTTGRYRSIPFSDLEGWRGRPPRPSAPAGGCSASPRRSRSSRAGAGARVGRLRRRLLACRAQQRRRRRGRGGGNRRARPLPCLCAPGGARCRRARRRPRRGLGYALPGTVLALGLLIPLAAFDNRLDALAALGASAFRAGSCSRAVCS